MGKLTRKLTYTEGYVSKAEDRFKNFVPVLVKGFKTTLAPSSCLTTASFSKVLRSSKKQALDWLKVFNVLKLGIISRRIS
jgi:endo-1,4-beta-mannosidase